MTTLEFQTARVIALEKEVKRLESIITEIQVVSLKQYEYNPDYDKPLSELNINYEIIQK